MLLAYPVILNNNFRNMRKIFFLIIILLITITTQTKAQSTQPYNCPALQTFNGEWRYVNGNDTLRVYLRYHQCFSPGINKISGDLYGWHEFKKGNQVIESDYEKRFMPLPVNYNDFSQNSFSILLTSTGCDTTSHRLRGTIMDISQARELKDVTIFFNPTITQLQWSQEHGEWYGAFTGAKGMTLPRSFVLTKQ